MRLTFGDYDPRRQTLLIRDSKFHKSRLVPLSADGVHEIESYRAVRRTRQLAISPESPLLWHHTRRGTAYSCTGLGNAMRRLLRAAQIATHTGRLPRVHDFRHTFAVQALLRWYGAGADVSAELPLLANCMGHVSIVSTEDYLQFVEPLATLASERFARHCGALVAATACPRRCTMKAVLPNTLARTLRGFFADHLPRVRGTIPHTVHSYRDTFVLLLRFIADRRRRSVADLDVEDLGPQDVLDFLHHLEVERLEIAATRNVRLAAIHASFGT